MSTPDTRGVLLQKAGGYPHIAHLCMIAHRQRVLYVCRTRVGLREIATSINSLDLPGVKVRLTNGEESVHFPEGGSIHFGTERAPNARGRVLDHVFLDSHHYLDDPNFRREVEPAFSGIAPGERYTVIG